MIETILLLLFGVWLFSGEETEEAFDAALYFDQLDGNIGLVESTEIDLT